MMSLGTLLTAFDLGTATTTARFTRVRDSHDAAGKTHRQPLSSRSPIEKKSWPGGNRGDTIGKACLPTDLIYDRVTGDLLFWGFEAQRYLDDPDPEFSIDRVLVVQHIKLLLNDPEKAKSNSPAIQRYRKVRGEIFRVLGKTPFDLFADFVDVIVNEVIKTAKRYFQNFIPGQIELVLAFPSGWSDSIHRQVAAIGAGAIKKALATNQLQSAAFAIENVYTVSETLCGVKEWLAATMDDEEGSLDFVQSTKNIAELSVGDVFIAADIGGGTGCMTVLKLVSKEPLQVDQLGKTKSLEVSGEAVEAEFERKLRLMITQDDYDGDIERQIKRICRLFKEEKKDCSPRLGNSTWTIEIKLRPNPAKGFYANFMKIDRELLDGCFDPIIDTLKSAIKQILENISDIKAIIFLGQFGGSSSYLRKCLARSSIATTVKLRHSQTGKMDVVIGALKERMELRESFIRESQTVKSYGTLVTVPWSKGQEGMLWFPNAIADGAVEFEKHPDGLWLKVIEWAIPNGIILENQSYDIATDEKKNHTWLSNDREIRFEDIIIVSDECPPAEENGRSYTLWTKAHEQNELFINGKHVEVQQISFSWDLSMSEKLSAVGDFLGSYSIKDLEYRCLKPSGRKKGSKYVRILHYNLVWEITEMQVKTYVKAIFPKAVGPPTMQLAKQRPVTAGEMRAGESRSLDLEHDIMITEGIEDLPAVLDGDHDADEMHTDPDVRGSGLDREASIDLDDFIGTHSLLADPARARSRQQMETPSHDNSGTQLRNRSLNRSMAGNNTQIGQWRIVQAAESPAGTSSPRQDGRYREGCYTCKDRKKKCDTEYFWDQPTQASTCIECNRQGIECHMKKPDWADDPVQVMLREEERKLILLGKRKSRDLEGVASESRSRGRSGDRERSSNFGRDGENFQMGRENPVAMSGPSVQKRIPGKGKAIRGGLSRRV
ncbi:hypothetical protein ONS95_011626 [Cadophora gregata]|uniref:uncharacterized protein n=1 Tax=Cadophora gregata TaxID=51156 RepID=UPI0026DD77BA|nr:uncharacterized protein ONS95_011626 [Cadophora gregata]KAK0120220.1 hypothetical protein ONS95_011626 [Cadophora gregata]